MRRMLNKMIRYISNEIGFFQARKSLEQQKLTREKEAVNKAVSLVCTLRRA